jgi:hypothetical protein
MIEYPILGYHGRGVGHGFRNRFGGQVERMGLLIPYTDEFSNLGL